MKSKTVKGIAMAALAGTLLQFGGCLNLGQMIRYGAWYAAFEYVTDQDIVFDLFEGGA